MPSPGMNEYIPKPRFQYQPSPYQPPAFTRNCARSVACDYFTDAIDYTQVQQLDEFESADVNGVSVAHGEVRVNRQVVGFKKVKFYTLENVGAGNLSRPEQEMQTIGFWLHVPRSWHVFRACRESKTALQGWAMCSERWQPFCSCTNHGTLAWL